MPLYEYRCKQCGHQFEKIQSFSAPELKECPVCQGEIERLLSAPAIQFKGAGWYVNDYAGKGAASKPKNGSSGDGNSSSDSKSSGESSSSKNSESSSATKSESSTPAASRPTAKSE